MFISLTESVDEDLHKIYRVINRKVLLLAYKIPVNIMRDFQTWLITQVTAARGAACQFPSELPVCPGCSVYNSQAA